MFTLPGLKTADIAGKEKLYKLRSASYTFFVLLFLGSCLGLASMYLAAATYHLKMFLSYFLVPVIPVLNILPVVLCIFLFYFIFNRVWISFFATSVLTIVLTLINYYKLLFRNDPLLAADLTMASEAMNMTGRYAIKLDWKIILVIIACILGTAAAFFLAKQKIRLMRLRLVGIAVIILVGICCYKGIYMDSKIYTAAENNRLINKWSSTQVYISKGFLYPFIYSIKSSISKPPAGYSEKEAKELLYSYKYSNIPNDKKVNVISIMMESYSDFSKYNQISFNQDVYGYLHQLEAESYSGELVDNIFAGGTIVTERNFLTGFTTVPDFRKNTNSYARYLGEQGYTVEGSHPGHDWFYNRKNINEYLGFKNYYFFENYYSPLATTAILKDSILFPQIIKLYEDNKKTGKPYFSFNVTYQNHGPYSSERLTDVDYVKNNGYSEKDYNIFNNYISGISSTTEEIKKLIDYFRAEKEPVVVILFGDHNPWLGDNNSVYKALGINLDPGTEEGFYNYYETPYIIWGNGSAKKVLGNEFRGKGPSIGPYFLMNEFFSLAGYEGNEFMKLSNDLRASMDVVHYTGRYKEAGVLTWKPTTASQKKLNDFVKVQYYWQHNFKSSPVK